MQNQPKYQTLAQPYHLDHEHPMRILRNELNTGEDFTFVHWHDCFEIALCLRGNSVTMIGDGGTELTGPGDVCIFAPGVPHFSHNTGGEENSFWIWGFFNFYQLLAAKFPDFDLKNFNEMADSGYAAILHSREDIGGLLRQLYENREDSDEAAAWSLILAKRVVALRRETTPETVEKNISGHRNRGNMQRLEKAIKLISREYKRKITVREMASVCGMSENNFRRIFDQCLGVLPQEYLHSYRCVIAKSHLQENRISISEISYLCGYQSISSFNRQFLKNTGMSPREYQKANGK